MPIMRASGALLYNQPKAELLWASTREVLNLFQAEEAGCAIITVPHDILAKAAKMIGLDLAGVSLDTVKMFLADSTLRASSSENPHLPWRQTRAASQVGLFCLSPLRPTREHPFRQLRRFYHQQPEPYRWLSPTR